MYKLVAGGTFGRRVASGFAGCAVSRVAKLAEERRERRREGEKEREIVKYVYIMTATVDAKIIAL